MRVNLKFCFSNLSNSFGVHSPSVGGSRLLTCLNCKFLNELFEMKKTVTFMYYTVVILGSDMVVLLFFLTSLNYHQAKRITQIHPIGPIEWNKQSNKQANTIKIWKSIRPSAALDNCQRMYTSLCLQSMGIHMNRF